MIRQLAQCPYCQLCEIGLDDHPQLVFNPGGDPPVPCPHLAWVDGRYSQWGLTEHGHNREIGSVEFCWSPNEPDRAAGDDPLLPYLRELVRAGSSWAYAPGVPFVVQTLNAEERVADSHGKPQLLWDVDGWAIFASDPAGFWAALPDCQQRQLASFKME